MHFKKLLLILSFLFVAFIMKSDVVLASSEQQKEIVRVGYIDNYGMIRAGDSLVDIGYGYDYLENIEYNSNLEFEYFRYDEIDFYEAGDNYEFDLYGPAYKVEDEEERYIYSENTIGIAQLMVVTDINNDVNYADPKAFEGKTVSTYPDNPTNEMFSDFLENNNINVEYIYGEPFTYFSKPADYYLTSSLNDNLIGTYKTVLNLGYKETYFVTQKGNEELMEKIDTAILDSFQINGNNLFDMLEKYYGSDYSVINRDLRKDEVELFENSTFTVGYKDTLQPYHFTDDGTISGISTQILNYLSEQYSFDIEYKEYDVLTEQDDFDIIISVVDDKNSSMENYVASAPYYSVDMVYLSKHINQKEAREDIETIGVVNYSSLDIAEIYKEFPGATVYEFNNFDECLVTYQLNQIDTVVFSEASIEYALTVLGSSEVEVYGTEIELPLRLFISKDIADDYLTPFEVVFKLIPASILKDIELSESTLFKPGYVVRSFLDNFWYIIFIPFAIVIIALYYYYFRKEKQMSWLNKEVYIDQLTGVYNRKKLDSLAKDMQNETNPYAVLYLDLDKFKTVNDVYGHDTGDKLLVIFTKRIKQIIRDRDIFIRIGGDEFIIVVQEVKNKNELINLVSRLEWAIISKFKIDDIEIEIESSIGYAVYPDNGSNIDEVIAAADNSMYQDKKAKQQIRDDFNAVNAEILDEQKE